MDNKTKQLINYGFYAFVGTIALIILGFTFYANYSSVGRDSSGIAQSGWQTVRLFDYGRFTAFMTALFMLIMIILALIMLAWAILGILNIMGKSKFKFNICKLKFENFGKYLFMAFGGVAFLIFLFMFINVFSLKEVEDYGYGYTFESGIHIGIGCYLSLILFTGGVIAIMLLKRAGKLNKYLLDPVATISKTSEVKTNKVEETTTNKDEKVVEVSNVEKKTKTKKTTSKADEKTE